MIDFIYIYIYIRSALILICLLGFAGGDSLTLKEGESIQAAINGANPGELILVGAGTYHENVVVDKPLILRGIGMPVVDCEGNGSTITLSADEIVLDGFMVTNSSRFSEAIKIISNNNTIKYNTVKNSGSGISIINSRNNTVEANNASYNEIGISLSSSFGNQINNNSIISNNQYGISIESSNSNNISNNNASQNSFYGISISNSNYNNITNNNVNHNEIYGLWLLESNDNAITSNNFSQNPSGIYLEDSGENIFKRNNVS